jgi:hypothetical protein
MSKTRGFAECGRSIGTKEALRSLEQSVDMDLGKAILLQHELNQERIKTKNLEEALYCETLAKMSERKKAEVSMLSMYSCYAILFVFIGAITLSGVPSC